MDVSSLAPVVAACARHPDQRSVDICQRCGDYVCLSCAEFEAGAAWCPACRPVTALHAAELGPRFVGNLLDSLVFWGFLTAGGFVGQASGVGSGLALVAGALVLLANAVLLQRRGQTFGKLVTGTRIVSTTDQRVPLVRILVLRGGVQALGAATAIGFVDAVFILGETRRTLHDRAAGTRVVDASSSEHVYAAQ